jgi:hypothetical protein
MFPALFLGQVINVLPQLGEVLLLRFKLFLQCQEPAKSPISAPICQHLFQKTLSFVVRVHDSLSALFLLDIHVFVALLAAGERVATQSDNNQQTSVRCRG